MKITLKDGSVKEVQKGISVLELAKEISEGLARNATCGKVNGEVKDPVSYTHLDVYKRQSKSCSNGGLNGRKSK